MKIGYVVDDNDKELQKLALDKAGCTKILSGSFNSVLKTLTPGDSIVIWRIDKLGHTATEIEKAIHKAHQAHVTIDLIFESISSENLFLPDIIKLIKKIESL